MLTVNQDAPAFDSVDEAGNALKLDDFLDKNNVVLYFYPKDDTPGCTIEANQFTALLDEFSALDTVIIGVSKDSCDSHQAFIEKFGLKVRLMSDTSGEVCEAYEVWQPKEKNGVTSMGIVRSTFVIDKQGKLASVEYNVVADGHAQQVLDLIKQIS
jgi:peroxiredoxin